MENILVDDFGRITAVVDWEFVSALPVWRACQPPKLIDGPMQSVKPDINAYYRADLPSELQAKHPEAEKNILDKTYWEHLEEYERGILRPFYLQELERFRPEMMKRHREYQAKYDFDAATTWVDLFWVAGAISSWVEKFGTIEAFSLKRLRNNELER
jgi:hypothetical protein